jgi:hypothetical protein
MDGQKMNAASAEPQAGETPSTEAPETPSTEASWRAGQVAHA